MTKYCDNCGSKVFNLGCTNCDEQNYIDQQVVENIADEKEKTEPAEKVCNTCEDTGKVVENAGCCGGCEQCGGSEEREVDCPDCSLPEPDTEPLDD